MDIYYSWNGIALLFYVMVILPVWAILAGSVCGLIFILARFFKIKKLPKLIYFFVFVFVTVFCFVFATTIFRQVLTPSSEFNMLINSIVKTMEFRKG